MYTHTHTHMHACTHKHTQVLHKTYKTCDSSTPRNFYPRRNFWFCVASANFHILLLVVLCCVCCLSVDLLPFRKLTEKVLHFYLMMNKTTHVFLDLFKPCATPPGNFFNYKFWDPGWVLVYPQILRLIFFPCNRSIREKVLSLASMLHNITSSWGWTMILKTLPVLMLYMLLSHHQ